MHECDVASKIRRPTVQGRPHLADGHSIEDRFGGGRHRGLDFVAISILAAHWLTMPQRHPLSVGKTPGDLGIEFENVRFPAHGDGVEIAGWFIPSAGSQ